MSLTHDGDSDNQQGAVKPYKRQCLISGNAMEEIRFAYHSEPSQGTLRAGDYL
jgi:hypothetical protein